MAAGVAAEGLAKSLARSYQVSWLATAAQTFASVHRPRLGTATTRALGILEIRAFRALISALPARPIPEFPHKPDKGLYDCLEYRAAFPGRRDRRVAVSPALAEACPLVHDQDGGFVHQVHPDEL